MKLKPIWPHKYYVRAPSPPSLNLVVDSVDGGRSVDGSYYPYFNISEFIQHISLQENNDNSRCFA